MKVLILYFSLHLSYSWLHSIEIYF